MRKTFEDFFSARDNLSSFPGTFGDVKIEEYAELLQACVKAASALIQPYRTGFH
jgi:hypothetical protein